MTRTHSEALRLIGRLKAGLIAVSVVAFLAVAAAGVTYQRFSTLRPLVVVEGRTISKREYQAVLDQKAGKQVLQSLVFGELIRQAASKAHVLPTPKDVDGRVGQFRAQTPNFDKVVALAGGPDQFRSGVLTDMALENLRTQGVTASDAEVAAFYSAHQAQFRRQPHAQILMVGADSAAGVQSAARLLSQGVAPDAISRQPDLHVVGQGGYAPRWDASQRGAFAATLKAMSAGQVKVIPVGSQQYAVKVVTKQPAETLPLSQVREQIARVVELQKAPSAAAEMAALYKAHRPDFAIDRYADYFRDVESFTPPQSSPKVARLP